MTKKVNKKGASTSKEATPLVEPNPALAKILAAAGYSDLGEALKDVMQRMAKDTENTEIGDSDD